jgi:serine/threonine protein kinase
MAETVPTGRGPRGAEPTQPMGQAASNPAPLGSGLAAPQETSAFPGPSPRDTKHPHDTLSPPHIRPGPAPAPGSRPLPEYELVSLLGRGGFGEVWKAVGPGGFEVALKFIHLGEQAGRVELRALQLMKGIRHAHLLPLFGAWQMDDQLVVAMELGDRTLMQRLQEAQAEGLAGIPRDELLEYMREAAKGLDFLNEYRPAGERSSIGVQHKDVKPQNLLLVGGTVKVADFGLARALEHTAMTVSSSVTPAYTAPEFLSGRATRWSDQYCLAVTYCHLRGGRLPFAGSAMEMMAGHMMHGPDLSMLPEAERPAVARALAKKPEERWPNCRAFVDAVASAGRGAVTQVKRVSESLPPDMDLGWHPPAERRLGGWLLAVAAVLVGLLLYTGQLGKLLKTLFPVSSSATTSESGRGGRPSGSLPAP